MGQQHKGARVYAYTRVSTATQTEGFSLEAQMASINKYAEYHEMVIVRHYSDEGFSGKNIAGREQFQKMLEDIIDKRDSISYVLVFKLSRFGRNAADVLSSLQTMEDYGVGLICVEDSIDSSADSGKLLISVMAAMAEIERENILVQTMAGRLQKARDGGWNGGFAPYGYTLENELLNVNEEEAKIVRLIFDKYAHTTMGANGVAKWLNKNGYVKQIRQNGTLDSFSSGFVKGVLDNPIYAGKIAFGRRKNVKIEGKRNEYHVVKQDKYPVFDGKHQAIIDENLWNEVQAKRKDTGFRPEKLEKDHQYILSGLVKCPGCGASMYGIPSKKRRKDGTPYPVSYSYICRNKGQTTGHKCEWKRQVSCKLIDRSVEQIILSLVNDENFASVMKELIGQQLDTEALTEKMNRTQKNLHNLQLRQRKLEDQIDALDYDDPQYEKLFESLNRRLYETFENIGSTELQIEQISGEIQAFEQSKLSRDMVYEYLVRFAEIYDKMTELEKKTFMQSFIESIDLFPEKQPDGQWIKAIHFNFPVSYNGDLTKEIFLPQKSIVETVALLTRNVM